MSPGNIAPPNFSKTQRLVLFIDLHPLLALQNPSSYLAAVASAARRLLQFPPLSASLSAYKLFFSSLSPLRSASILPRHLSTPSLSFNLPPQTLDSLSETLNYISTLTDLPDSPLCSRASYVSSSLIQLVHDYSWETENDNLSGEDNLFGAEFMNIYSNLVVLLSPVAQSINSSLPDYLELREFDDVFGSVKEAFVVRDIHLCWVDVKSIGLEINENVKKNECGDELVVYRDQIRKTGWGFCSSDLIVLGSALLPLGLIYPAIGVKFDFSDLGGTDNKIYTGELGLEVLGVNGLPLECKCSDLEFVNVKSLNGQDGFLLRLGKGNLKLHVKSVHRYDDYEYTGSSTEIVLVRECFKKPGKNKTDSGEDFFANKVLEMLCGEMGEVACRNQIPTWQILLSYLHTNGYWAFVSISSSSGGDALVGSLKPFTAHLATLDILDASCVLVKDKHGSKSSKTHDLNNSGMFCGSQTDSTASNCIQLDDGKMKRSQRNLYKRMTWNSFCKAAIGGSSFDLFELYSASPNFEKSKRLKFLKCWMKQISKVSVNFTTVMSRPNSIEELSACNNVFSSEPSPLKEGVQPIPNIETSENFFTDLFKKIQHGLESGMDLQNLAESAVKSSVHWLHHNRENENNSQGQQQCVEISGDSFGEVIGSKLIEHLLLSPKEMKKIQQDSDPCLSDNIVREYEMQILLRIEILRSDVSPALGESRKKKLMKQICSLLEIIQYLVAGGIHGHISLYDYVEQTIKARYSDGLEDVVKKIYTEMDLLPFGDEEEAAPNLMFNSEDSNQSWPVKTEPNSLNHSAFSTEGDSSQPPANACDSPLTVGQDDYTQILNEAREKRERARRFAPFVSKARDLQRVWAPKQPKATKNKFNPILIKSKRKRDRHSSVVCETPMTGNYRASSKNDNNGDKAPSSVSKALFQDN